MLSATQVAELLQREFPQMFFPGSGTTIEDAEPAIAANAMSASAMWAANAATVSPDEE